MGCHCCVATSQSRCGQWQSCHCRSLICWLLISSYSLFRSEEHLTCHHSLSFFSLARTLNPASHQLHNPTTISPPQVQCSPACRLLHGCLLRSCLRRTRSHSPLPLFSRPQTANNCPIHPPLCLRLLHPHPRLVPLSPGSLRHQDWSFHDSDLGRRCCYFFHPYPCRRCFGTKKDSFRWGATDGYERTRVCFLWELLALVTICYLWCDKSKVCSYTLLENSFIQAFRLLYMS